MNFKHPFTCCVAGPTCSGKSTWVTRLVENKNILINPSPCKVLWCYGEYQPGYQQLAKLPNVELVDGIPDLKMLKETSNIPKLLIFDDLMMRLGKEKNKELTSLFCQGSHHWNISIVHIVQNLFYNGLRNARINSHYLVLLKNPSDQLQVSTIGKQMYPGNSKYLVDAYKDACSMPYGYLLINSNPETDDNHRLMTNIFPGEIPVVYVKRI